MISEPKVQYKKLTRGKVKNEKSMTLFGHVKLQITKKTELFLVRCLKRKGMH